MKDNLNKESKKDMELNITSMAISIPDNGKITNPMDMESTIMLKEVFTRDFGSIIRNIFSAVNLGMIMHSTSENSKMDSEMGRGN